MNALLLKVWSEYISYFRSNESTYSKRRIMEMTYYLKSMQRNECNIEIVLEKSDFCAVWVVSGDETASGDSEGSPPIALSG